MALILAILFGILAGVTHAKTTGKEMYSRFDKVLLLYLLPVLFLITGSRFEGAAASNMKVIGILTLITVASLVISPLVGKKIMKLDAEMLKGFVILAVCTNTGHGLMLLQSSDPEPETQKLAVTAFYHGFIVVTLVPQLLEFKPGNRKNSLRTIVNMILWHPVSVSCILGFGIALYPPFSFAYATLVLARIGYSKWQKKEWSLSDPWPIFALTVVLIAVAIHREISNEVKWYSLVVTFITAVTIGSKMATQKMESGHWKVVAGVMSFGLLIEPFLIGLPLAKLFGCNYAESYIIAYMKSQPPAYLGMLWLRQGKFGKLPVSEWAFSLQAIAAYCLAVFFPTILKALF